MMTHPAPAGLPPYTLEERKKILDDIAAAAAKQSTPHAKASHAKRKGKGGRRLAFADAS